MAGLGHGDSFVFRDPAGIRPAYFYQDDEVVVILKDQLFKLFLMSLLKMYMK
jgi:amidophosphoribosyltransferase